MLVRDHDAKPPPTSLLFISPRAKLTDEADLSVRVDQSYLPPAPGSQAVELPNCDETESGGTGGGRGEMRDVWSKFGALSRVQIASPCGAWFHCEAVRGDFDRLSWPWSQHLTGAGSKGSVLLLSCWPWSGAMQQSCQDNAQGGGTEPTWKRAVLKSTLGS